MEDWADGTFSLRDTLYARWSFSFRIISTCSVMWCVFVCVCACDDLAHINKIMPTREDTDTNTDTRHHHTHKHTHALRSESCIPALS